MKRIVCFALNRKDIYVHVCKVQGVLVSSQGSYNDL